jgi:hypothetical protein
MKKRHSLLPVVLLALLSCKELNINTDLKSCWIWNIDNYYYLRQPDKQTIIYGNAFQKLCNKTAKEIRQVENTSFINTSTYQTDST